MHEELSRWEIVHHLLVKTMSCSISIHPVNGTSTNWPIATMTLRQSSDFSLQYVIYRSLLTQQGFFSLSLSLCLIAPLSMLFKIAVSSGLVCLRQVSFFLPFFRKHFWWILRLNHSFPFLSCAMNDAVFGRCCKKIPEALMCPGNRPKHYTRGDLKFQLSCDKASHWTLLKGVNLDLETHSFSGVWQVVSLVFVPQLQTSL